MVPYDGYLEHLPHDPETVLRGIISISNHPDRRHQHKPYRSIFSDDEIKMIYQSISVSKPIQLSTMNSRVAVQRVTALFSLSTMNSRVAVQRVTALFSLSSMMIPLGWKPANDVDRNDVYALVNAFPRMTDGTKQSYKVWISLFFGFSRSGVSFNAFWERQPRSRKAK